MPERIQKDLHKQATVRACEDFIAAGRACFNGKFAELGRKADPHVDKITMDGKALSAAESQIYIALYKPCNVLSAVEKEPARIVKWFVI